MVAIGEAELPTGVTRWLGNRPHLFALFVAYRNDRKRLSAFLASGAAGLIAFACLPAAAVVLRMLAHHPIAAFTAFCVTSAILGTRLIARIRRQDSDSWLAPLPVLSSARLWTLLALLFEGGVLAIVIGLPVALGRVGVGEAGVVAGLATAGTGVGAAFGWWLQRGGRSTAPDFHYAPVRRPRVRWARYPRTSPLGFWPVALGRAYSKPSVSARALLIALMAVPLGTGGAEALAIGAGAIVLLHLAALTLAGIAVAVRAARWLAPTPITFTAFATAIGARALTAQFVVCATVILLMSAAALEEKVVVGTIRVSIFWLLFSAVAITGACWFALGNESRGRRVPERGSG